MKNGIILAGAAALAFAAPVLAQPGKGGGNGGGGNKGGGAPAKVERGGGGGGQQRMERGGGGPQQRADRGGGPQQQVRGPDRREVRAERRVERQQPRADRAPIREARDNRGSVRRDNRADDRRAVEQRGRGSADSRVTEQRGRTATDRAEQRDRTGESDRVAVQDRRTDDGAFRTEQRTALFTSPTFRSTGLLDGCPPGLAAKGNGCLPPGQAKKLVGAAIPATLGSALLPPLYRSWYPDNDDYFYRTADGYVYRVNRDQNLVDAYWPLADEWDGAYYVGTAYPQDYLGYYNVPVQYQPWYADNADDYYRYGDGAIYQVDRDGGVIESIVSLLAGGVGVGQPLPAGYDVYNVPYEYRDRYVDGPDSLYRYNDGYIYEVDPTTRIVQAIVETLV
jgi:hypothetical protein